MFWIEAGLRERRFSGFMAVLALGALLSAEAQGGLVYHQNFDAGNGTPVVTPGGGELAVATGGASGNAVFSATGGILNGSLDSSSPSSANGASGFASTTVAGGTSMDLGTMSQFTVTLWVRAQDLQTGANARHSRLLILGNSVATDFVSPNAVGIVLRNDRSAVANRRFIDAYVNGASASPLSGGNPTGIPGTQSAINEWTFIALTYDGTSTLANDSSVQSTATGGASSINGQLYRGTSAASPSRSDAPFTNNAAVPGTATDPSAGPVNFGVGSVLHLANYTGMNRGLDGWMDDVRIYDSVLTPADVDYVRRLALPEPTSVVLLGLGAVAGLRRRRR